MYFHECSQFLFLCRLEPPLVCLNDSSAFRHLHHFQGAWHIIKSKHFYLHSTRDNTSTQFEEAGIVDGQLKSRNKTSNCVGLSPSKEVFDMRIKSLAIFAYKTSARYFTNTSLLMSATGATWLVQGKHRVIIPGLNYMGNPIHLLFLIWGSCWEYLVILFWHFSNKHMKIRLLSGLDEIYSRETEWSLASNELVVDVAQVQPSCYIWHIDMR